MVSELGTLSAGTRSVRHEPEGKSIAQGPRGGQSQGEEIEARSPDG